MKETNDGPFGLTRVVTDGGTTFFRNANGIFVFVLIVLYLHSFHSFIYPGLIYVLIIINLHDLFFLYLP